jgi:sulfur carrier protein ThiS adenylyltransferase
MVFPDDAGVRVYLNGNPCELAAGQTIGGVLQQYCQGAHVVIVNSVPVSDLSTAVREGDHVRFFMRGCLPEQRELEALIFARQPESITGSLKAGCVGIAGAGGLGSVLAENLARSGVGKLVIADFDCVEPSNLNRQRYSLEQIGLPKVQALADNISRFNPFITVVAVHERITVENAAALFKGCGIVAECLDSAAEKASLVSGMLKHMPQAKIVAASGLAGIGDGADIVVRKIGSRLYLVGDAVSDAASGAGLFASRVGIAASMQSHVIIRLLAGEEL